MRYEEVMTPLGVKYIQGDEMRELLVKKISEMGNDIAELLFHLLQDAAQRQHDAGMSGEHGDRGASHITTGVEMYVHGWFKLVPREWTTLEAKLKAQKDPEWSEYQRLKQKFEGGARGR